MKMRFFVLFAASLPTLAQFAWRDTGTGRLELTQKGQPVLVYNYGPQLANGAPQDRRRCCYISPIYTPSGVVPTEDFPKDHWHHHGIFWAWPQVSTPSGQYDFWMYKGVEQRFVKWLEKKPGSLRVENGWFAGGKQLVRETVSLRVDADRILHVELKLEALGEPVTLAGSREQGKGYGGFSARFAPRENTVIRTSDGEIKKDEDLNPHAWAELEGTYQGKRALLRITPDPENPNQPDPWCLRFYGFVGSSWPNTTPRTLDPGRPVVLKYRVSVTDVR
jgi:hypothetical protein